VIQLLQLKLVADQSKLSITQNDLLETPTS